MPDLCYRHEIPGDAPLLALPSLPKPFVFPHLCLGSHLSPVLGDTAWHEVVFGLICAPPWKVSLALGPLCSYLWLGVHPRVSWGAGWGESSCAVGTWAVQGCVGPQSTEGDSLRMRKRGAVGEDAAGALSAAGRHCLFYLTIVLCSAGRDLLFHKFGWKGEFGRALGCRGGFMAAPCSPCRAGASADMPGERRRRKRWRREPTLASVWGTGSQCPIRGVWGLDQAGQGGKSLVCGNHGAGGAREGLRPPCGAGGG